MIRHVITALAGRCGGHGGEDDDDDCKLSRVRFTLSDWLVPDVMLALLAPVASILEQNPDDTGVGTPCP